MAEQPDLDLALALLQQIQTTQREMRDDLREQRTRLTSVERIAAHIEHQQAEQRAEFHGWLDRVADRLERIERRLDLVDGGPA
jgi:two-component sensor histidine kinase